SGDNAETTVPDYVELARNLGGTAWQIQAFKFDGRLRAAPDGARAPMPEKMLAQRLALAPAFGKALRNQALERNPPILVARVNVEPAAVAVGDVVTFNGAASQHLNPHEYIDSWTWDFDDNGTEDAWGDVVATSFDTSGDHVVVLYVADRDGNAAHARVIVRVQ
ncbi:MAG: PKD domain-containing protein, partial [Gammaproteobacteria bacterium]|nr:PKD domain-containing protein [Gammaproteobacteria bacterium]